MNIETRLRNPEFVENGEKYYIEINMGPFTKEEYDIQMNRLKKLSEESRILQTPEYTGYCKVYGVDHECGYVNEKGGTINYCSKCGKLTKYEN